MLIIGIAGGSGSGKTTVVKEITKRFPFSEVTVIPQDAYYKDQGTLSLEEKKLINFDHPSSIEFSLLVEHLKCLKSAKGIDLPIYSYLTCARAKETVRVDPTAVIIIEGILVLADPEVRDLMDVKIFVDADADDRLMRIIGRDVQERGRNYQEVLVHYQTYVKPMHLQFIEPAKRYADIIVPQGGQNKLAIDIICSHIKGSFNY